MLLWSRAVAPGLDPFTTVHLDRLTAEGFAELGGQFGHDDLGSLGGSMFLSFIGVHFHHDVSQFHELLCQRFHDLDFHY